MTSNGIASRVVNVEVRKHYIRSIQEDVAMQHIGVMTNAASTPKWKLELAPVNDRNQWYLPMGNYPTEVAFALTLTGPESANADNEVSERLHVLYSTLGKIKGTQKFYLHSVNGEEWKPLSPAARAKQSREKAEGIVSYAEVSMPTPEEQAECFSGMFGVDAQIDLITRYMETSIDSGFKSRSHAVLLGPPGCGKSKTLEKAASMFGPDAVLTIDGTAMTSAGITKLLDELETMPRFLIVEEIDKAPNDAVAVYLGLMDQRGELRKTTFRQNIQKDCRVCVFATANSYTKLKNMQEGALASRFGNPIVYGRPDEEQMRKILRGALDEYEIRMCKDAESTPVHCGQCKNCKRREQWIDRVLDWCGKWHDTLQADTYDPRFAIRMLVNGQDDLLNDKHQRLLEKTSIRKDAVLDFD